MCPFPGLTCSRSASGLQGDVEDQLLSHPVLQDELNNPKNGDSAHKHLKQQVPQTVKSFLLRPPRSHVTIFAVPYYLPGEKPVACSSFSRSNLPAVTKSPSESGLFLTRRLS